MTNVARLDLRSTGGDLRPTGGLARVPVQRGADRHGPGGFLPRPRLLEAFRKAIGGVLTLVTAPVGYGKSVLIDAWLAEGTAPGPVVRIVCAESDREPEFFWRHLVAALRRDVPSLRQTTVALGLADPATPHRLPPDVVDRMALTLRSSDRPVVVVVDEAERLGMLVLEDLEELVRRAGPAIRLVLGSRETPLIRPPHDAIRGSMSRITGQDLAFTVAEARELLERRGVALSDGPLADLVQLTEGWPAVVGRVATDLAASQDPESDVASLLRDSTLTDAPLSDVLDAQPPAVRAFLLRTSIADPLWPGLATALSSEQDATGLLGALLRANLFVAVAPEGPRCYQYQPMLRSLLRSQLEEAAPQEVSRLHLAAARWLQDAGLLSAAATHLTQVGRWSAAAALVVEDLRVGELVWGVGPLAELFAGMPESAAGPEASLVRASLQVSKGEAVAAPGADAILTEADDGSLEHADSLLLSLGVLEVQLARNGSDPEAALLAAHTAQQRLAAQPRELVAARPALVATLLAAEGAAHLRKGHLEEAAYTLTEGLTVAGGEECTPARLACVSRLALTEAIRGRLRQAELHVTAAEALARALGTAPEQQDRAVQVTRAWLHTERYAVGRTRVALQGLPVGPVSAVDPVVTGCTALLRSRLAAAEGNPREAMREIAQIRSESEVLPLPMWLDQRLRSTLASLLAGQDEGAEVAPLPDASGAPVPLDLRVESWLRRASHALSLGETRRARSALEQALHLAEPERLHRPFAEAPPRLRAFLASDNGLRVRRQWLGPLDRSGDLSTEAAGGSSGFAEPLTAKESEVLELLSDLLSTQEIAQAMFVSVNTVRSHVRSILRKLSATRRNEAVRHARDLGLISR